jgi:hypothetical protein
MKPPVMSSPPPPSQPSQSCQCPGALENVSRNYFLRQVSGVFFMVLSKFLLKKAKAFSNNAQERGDVNIVYF